MKIKSSLLAFATGLFVVAGINSDAHAVPAGTILQYQNASGDWVDVGTTLQGSKTISQFYNYDGAGSSRNSLQLSNTAVFTVYNDGLIGLFDARNSGSGGHLKASITGLKGTGATYIAKDESGQGNSGSNETDVYSLSAINTNWNKDNTDGFALKLNSGTPVLYDDGGVYFDVKYNFSVIEGIKAFALVTGSSSTPDYTYVTLNSGSELHIRAIAPNSSAAVPEPGSMLLLGSGLFGAVSRRRKSQKTA